MKRSIPLLFALLFSVVCHSTDIAPGNVSGTWSPEGNPYIVNGTIRIPAGESLQILPGTQVLFSAFYGLQVLGTLDCQGAAGDSIMIAGVAGGNWQGIRFDSLAAGSDTARIAYCNLSNMYHGGIKIVNTSRVVISDSRIHHNLELYAGVVYIAMGSPIIRNNVFHNNSAETGSGYYGHALYVSDASPIVTGNTFTHYTGAPNFNYGAITIWRYNQPTMPVIDNNIFESIVPIVVAIDVHSNCVPVISNNVFRNLDTPYLASALWIAYVQAAELQITGNEFINNHADDDAGAIKIIDSRVRLADNVFEHNTTDGLGGAIYIVDEAEVVIEDCMFSWNEAMQGGAIHAVSSTVNIDRCLMHNNEAVVGGAIYTCGMEPSSISNTILANNSGTSIAGAIYSYLNMSLQITNCNIVNNTAPTGAALYLYWGASPVLTNCILWGNMAGDVPNNVKVQDYIWNYCTPSFYHCIVQGGESSFVMGTSTVLAYEDNLEADPQFVAPTLSAGNSVDATNASWNVWQETSPAIDAGADTDLAGTSDIMGESRIQGSAIDIGAYEGGFIISPADFNQDGEVDALDLDMLLAGYGCYSDCGILDLDGDGIVSMADVQILVGWM